VKSDLLSLDFVVNRFFMKLLKTNNIDVVKLVNSTSMSRCQAPCGKNAPQHFISSSSVQKIISVKLHRILSKFVHCTVMMCVLLYYRM